jgi:hypothetical protein
MAQDENNDKHNQKTKHSQVLPATNQQISQDLPTPAVDTSQINISTPATASDSDLIEKEWVEKAKEIVEKTRSNPYQKQEELAKMKADYLKKRYNREVRPSDD